MRSALRRRHGPEFRDVTFNPNDDVLLDGMSSSDGCLEPDEESDPARVVEELSRKETAKIKACRVIILLAIVVSGGVLSGLSYHFMSREVKENSNTKYDAQVSTIFQTIETRVTNLKIAFRNLGESVAASGEVASSEFPFVTVPMFQLLGEHVQALSNVERVVYGPLVGEDQVELWNNYSVQNQDGIQMGDNTSRTRMLQDNSVSGSITPFIFQIERNGTTGNFSKVPSKGPAPYNPFWQSYPHSTDRANFDLLSGGYRELYNAVLEAREALFSPITNLTVLRRQQLVLDLGFDEGPEPQRPDISSEYLPDIAPHSVLLQPVFSSVPGNDSDVVGLLYGPVAWETYISNLRSDAISDPLYLVLGNNCGQSYSYILEGTETVFLGHGDQHDTEWSSHERVLMLDEYVYEESPSLSGHCVYWIRLYPTDEFWSGTRDLTPPIVFSSVAAVSFALMAIVFLLYDGYVHRRNEKVVGLAAKSNHLIASLFPSTVRDRVIAAGEPDRPNDRRVQSQFTPQLLSGFSVTEDPSRSDDDDDDVDQGFDFATAPIADFFPETTILFADIAGFTAWSSAREPSQVFALLETLYSSFDYIARKRRIFKVETIGDCYVASAGVPDPRPDHAVAMTRFARDCLFKTRSLTKKLEKTLGPGTRELSVRIGLHSGPVTGGVLRGERSRFQLFGDTMNTASRIETTGKSNQIHISDTTAQLLVEAGKSRWLVPRDEKVFAKGKGEMSTFWLQQSLPKAERLDADSATDYESTDETISYTSESSMSYSSVAGKDGETTDLPRKLSRLIDWNVDLLLRFLKPVLIRQDASGDGDANCQSPPTPPDSSVTNNILEEVVDSLEIPVFADEYATMKKTREINPDLGAEVYGFVRCIALKYRNNAFHNFEHASHVSMSVVKLLSRVISSPLSMSAVSHATEASEASRTLHHQTFGLSSDPLIQFACVFAAFIHCVGHPGKSNSELAYESDDLTQRYGPVSTSEQHSFHVAWDTLHRVEFAALKRAIFPNDTQMRRFRQSVINFVLATDLRNADLKKMREERWTKVFLGERSVEVDDVTSVANLRATATMEFIIQASSVAHTMQHWHVFYKWSFALLRERSMSADPARNDIPGGWFERQLAFFDSTVIPLAKKLGGGVFGATGKQYLSYALENREEWCERGLELLAEVDMDKSWRDNDECE